MKTFTLRLRVTSFLLISAILSLNVGTSAQAAMVSTESYLEQKTQTTPRDRVLHLLQREEVRRKLSEFGVDPLEAKLRIASLSDAEIEKLSVKIDQAPAGADAAGAILGTALVVFIVLLITDILCWTKVFKFTRCAA